jgi:hypothetical protein
LYRDGRSETESFGNQAVSFSDWGCHEFRRFLGVPHLVVGSIINFFAADTPAFKHGEERRPDMLK